MPVAGYNVKPDENDHEPIISIDLEEVIEHLAGQACICIGEGYDQTQIHLDYYELCAFIGQAKYVRTIMEWNMATYAYASQGGIDTNHLVIKGNAKLERVEFTIEPKACKFEKSLCGRPAPIWQYSHNPRGWDIEPVLGDPKSMHTCKRCYAVWQKQQRAALKEAV